MPLQSRLALVGLSRQSAKGTVAASTQYGIGLLGGGVLSVEFDQEPDEVTSLSRIYQQDIRKAVKCGATFDVRANPALVGLLYYGALGAIATTGTTDLTHVITPAALPLYLSLFGNQSGDSLDVRDCMIDELKITWEKAAPAVVSVTLMGTVLRYGTAWTATNDLTASDDKLAGHGGTFKLDVDSATAVEAQIVGGEITIKNNIQPVELSKSVLPDDVFPGLQEIEVSLDLLPADLTDWRAIATGTPTGTAIQGTPVNGSFDELFQISATKSLQLAATRVPFMIDYPEPDVGGGPLAVKAVGRVRKPAGTAFTATVKNQTASYPAV